MHTLDKNTMEKLKISKNILSIYQSQTREFFRAREKKKKEFVNS